MYCLMETFSNFSPKEDFALLEYQQFLELVCSDFPRHLLLEAAIGLTVHSMVGATPKYCHGDLSVAIYFHIIYEDWLKEVEHFLRDEHGSCCRSMARIRNHFAECRHLLPLTVERPSATILEDVLARTTGPTQEISFEELRKMLLVNEAVISDVCKVPVHATPIVSATAGSMNEPTSSQITSRRPQEASADL